MSEMMIAGMMIGVVVGSIAGVGVAMLMQRKRSDREIRTARQDAVAGSRRVMTGQITEQLAPVLPGFGYNYKDCLFMGKGVDYIVFDGLTDGQVREVVLVEIKTGRARLTQREQQIKTAITDGRVRYETVRVAL